MSAPGTWYFTLFLRRVHPVVYLIGRQNSTGLGWTHYAHLVLRVDRVLTACSQSSSSNPEILLRELDVHRHVQYVGGAPLNGMTSSKI